MPQRAFPGAMGWGAESTGGRGGVIREVTNLDNSGSGSFREAVTDSSLATAYVVFRVAGEITLDTTVQMAASNIYVAGQTAPGSGITLLGEGLRVKGHEVVIRYLSWRGEGNHFFRTSPSATCNDVIVDHCSIAYGVDDMMNVDFGTGNEANPDTFNITVQNCLIGPHITSGKAFSVGSVVPSRLSKVSIHNNYIMGYNVRGPKIGEATDVQVVNNVNYNWDKQASDFKPVAEVDFIANYYERGPRTDDTANRKVWRYADNDNGEAAAKVYIAKNIVPHSTVGLTDITVDNYEATAATGGAELVFNQNLPPEDRDDAKRSPFAQHSSEATYPVSLTSAQSAFDRVPENAGNIHRLEGDGTYTLRRGATDQGFVDDVRDGTGITATPSSRGTLDTVDTGTLYTDTDGDGIGDEWEAIHKRGDANQVAEGGYTNIEIFLNGGPPIVPAGGGQPRSGGRGSAESMVESRKLYAIDWKRHVEAVERKMLEKNREVNRSREKTRTKKVPEGDFAKFKVQKKKEKKGPYEADIYLYPERKN